MITPSLARLTFVALLLAATPAFAATMNASPTATPAMVVLGSLVHSLLFAGMLFSLIAAIKIPGTGVPEAAFVVFLAALLVPAAAAGTAQWYEIVAIVGGIALLAIEIFIIPGFGATGVLGAILALGGLLLILVPDPRLHGHLDLIQIRNALATLIAGGVGGIAAFAWLGRYLPNIPRANRLVLNETNAPLPAGPTWPTFGDVGVCLTDLKPGGVVRLTYEGEARSVDVVSDRGYIAAGASIVVADIEGTRVIVRPLAIGPVATV